MLTQTSDGADLAGRGVGRDGYGRVLVKLLRDDRDRRIFRLSMAALATLIVEPVYVLVDTAIVGRLGTDPLASLAVAAIVILSINAFISFVEYITTDIAYAHGAAAVDLAKRAATNALWLGFGLGVAGGLLMFFVGPWFCHLLGARGNVYNGATTYVRVFSLSLPFSQITFVGHGVMRGVNRLRKPIVIVVVANVLNVILELIAVYSLDLGIAGSAWSTVIVIVGSALAFLVVLRPHVTLAWPEWEPIRKQLVSGLHLTIRVLGMLIIWVATTWVAAARVDKPTLAAQGVVNQMFMFLALAVDCFAIPAQSLVAGALGEGDVDGARSTGKACIRLSLWMGGAIGVMLVGGSWMLAHAFSGDAAVVSRITAGLVILGLMQFPGAVAFALDGVLIGARDERFLGRQAWTNLVSFLPLIAATAIWPSWGIIGLWLAQLSWMTMRAAVNVRRFRSTAWEGNFAQLPA